MIARGFLLDLDCGRLLDFFLTEGRDFREEDLARRAGAYARMTRPSRRSSKNWYTRTLRLLHSRLRSG